MFSISIYTYKWNFWVVLYMHFQLLAIFHSSWPTYTSIGSVWAFPISPNPCQPLVLSNISFCQFKDYGVVFYFNVHFFIWSAVQHLVTCLWPLVICLLVSYSLFYWIISPAVLLVNFIYSRYSSLTGSLHCKHFLPVCGLFLSLICSIFCLATVSFLR